MIVQAVECPFCKDIIYSRAHHDFHYCSCGKTGVDGGFDYLRVLWTDEPRYLEVEVEATKQELYDDWNNLINKFGLIKGEINEKS